MLVTTILMITGCSFKSVDLRHQADVNFNELKTYSLFEQESAFTEQQNINDNLRNGIELAIENTFDHHGFSYANIDDADIICLPSRSETFGMVVIEAMARKRLVVATRCGGPQGIIKHQDNGLLCDINADSLANALVAAIHLEAQEQHTLCEAAYMTAKDHYSLATVRQQIATMLKQLP